jgi:hypothetical protein
MLNFIGAARRKGGRTSMVTVNAAAGALRAGGRYREEHRSAPGER